MLDNQTSSQQIQHSYESRIEQELKANEELRRQLGNLERAYQEAHSGTKSKLEERALLLLIVEKRISDIIMIRANEDNGRLISENFALFQEKLLDKIGEVVKFNKQMQQELKEMESNVMKSAKETTNRDDQIHQLQVELQMVKEETNNDRNQNFHVNQRLQLLELELEQKNLMLSSWAKDKAELEEKRLILSHNETERIQYQGQVQKLREDLHAAKKREQLLEEKVKDTNKYEDERKQLGQLKIELDVKKKIGTELENENKLLLDRIRYLESQISILNKQLSNIGIKGENSIDQSDDSLVLILN